MVFKGTVPGLSAWAIINREASLAVGTTATSASETQATGQPEEELRLVQITWRALAIHQLP